jgi:hypothetical protein
MTSGARADRTCSAPTPAPKTLTEKAYAGLLWAQPEAPKRSARLSVRAPELAARTTASCSRSSAGGANAGPNPALYLNPRTTYEMTVLGRGEGQGRFKAGVLRSSIRPNSKDFDSRHALPGRARRVARQTSPGISALTAYRVPESDTAPAQPARVASVRARRASARWNLRAWAPQAVAGVPGLQPRWPSTRSRSAFGCRRLGRARGTRSSAYTATRGGRGSPSLTYRYAMPASPATDPNTAALRGGRRSCPAACGRRCR